MSITQAKSTNPSSVSRLASLNGIGIVTRILILVAVLSTFASAAALLVFGAIETVHFIDDLFFAEHGLGRDESLLHAIEIVDIFLLATVVQVVSLGLYQLYFDQDMRLPNWLKVKNLDDLKSKLVGVVVTVLAVFFVGQAVSWSEGSDIAYLGGATAAMIAAATYFLSKIRHD